MILKISLIVGLLHFIVSASNGQEWEKLGVTDLSYTISSFAVDQDQKLYLGSDDGNIYRYDTLGNQEQLYSDVNKSSVTLIEPWNRLKLFLFYRENQTIQLLNRFVISPQEILIQSLGIEFASLAAPGIDNSLWIYAANFNELRKYKKNQLMFTTPLTAIQSGTPCHLRAFQNLVLLLDEKTGFHFFDQFGNYALSIPIEGARYFQLLKNQVIAYNGSTISSFDPFHPKVIIHIPAPPGEFIGMIKTDSKYIFIGASAYYNYRLVE